MGLFYVTCSNLRGIPTLLHFVVKQWISNLFFGLRIPLHSFLLQGMFPTQGSNLGLPHCRQMLLPSEPPGNLADEIWKSSLKCFLAVENTNGTGHIVKGSRLDFTFISALFLISVETYNTSLLICFLRFVRIK